MWIYAQILWEFLDLVVGSAGIIIGVIALRKDKRKIKHAGSLQQDNEDDQDTTDETK